MMALLMELLHCFLKVGIKPGHAAGEEGVHHVLWEITAEVGMEECDQVGLGGFPWKRFTEATTRMVKSSHKTWLRGTQGVFHMGGVGTDGPILISLD